MTAVSSSGEAPRNAAARPEIERVWEWLAAVPDPEIPVVSVVDLGIVRALRWRDGALEVTVTPTYSGCPATAVIALEIEQALRARGLNDIRIDVQLSPAWTTGWISRKGREKLLAYGIAPPSDGACAGAMAAAGPVSCPRCRSEDTEEVSRFGSTPCKASWRCRSCLEPFDYFKSF